jgi:tetrapyrrole methylase family protein/MazG family protein
MPLQSPPDASLPGLDQLRAIVAALRAPNGCPWDQEQTHVSLRAGLLEEAYEVTAAIDAADDANLREELGDLLLQVVFHAQIAEEEGRFAFDAVALGIAQKLVRRHPHVFAGENAADSAEVLVRWEDIKRQERGGAAEESALAGVSPGLPALQYAAKIQKRAAKVGFDWQETRPVLEKIKEELAEVEADLEAGLPMEEELGDLLFAVVNLARKLEVDAEVALGGATRKFARRFLGVEELARTRGIGMAGSSLEALDQLWDEVKAAEKAASAAP